MNAWTTLALGILLLLLTIPIAIAALSLAVAMCAIPRADTIPCFIVGFGPETITAVAGLTLVARGVVLLVREKRDRP